jgi:hypothetical protein
LYFNSITPQEDLDVVAFAYSPVPYTVQPFLSSVNRHPDYLVYARETQNKPKYCYYHYYYYYYYYH